MRLNPHGGKFRWSDLTITWKISVSEIAVHVYKSPRGLWVAQFGTPYPHEFGSRTTAMKKAHQLAGRYSLRVLSE